MRLPEHGILRLRARSLVVPAAVTFRGMMLTKDGRIDKIFQTVNCIDSGAFAATQIPVDGGELISLEALGPADSEPPGTIVVHVNLGTAGSAYGGVMVTILNGTVSRGTRIAYGGGEVRGQGNAPAMNMTVQVPDPAAGAQWSWAPSSLVVEDVVWIRGRFVSDATVATRRHGLSVVLSAGTGLQYHGGMTQAASLTREVHWAKYGTAPFAVGTRLHDFLPDPLYAGNATIESLTDSIQAGDQWSNVVIAFRGYLVV